MTNEIQLHSGLTFDFDQPTVGMIRIGDIAYALAGIARFTGHARCGANGVRYSVGQHSILVRDILKHWGATDRVQLEGLLHDAQEFVMQDLSSPAKVRVPGYKDEENRVEKLVRLKFNLPEEQSSIVKLADLVALRIEIEHLMPRPDAKLWQWVKEATVYHKLPKEYKLENLAILNPHQTESLFLATYREIVE